MHLNGRNIFISSSTFTRRCKPTRFHAPPKRTRHLRVVPPYMPHSPDANSHPASQHTTVLHVDDDAFSRSMLATIIRDMPGYKLLGCPAGVAATKVALTQVHPDIIVLERRLMDGDGLELLSAAQKSPKKVHMIFLVQHLDDVTLHCTHSHEVSGLITKASDWPTHIRSGLYEIGRGNKFFPSDIRVAIRRFKSDPNAFFKILSRREIMLMETFAQGYSNRDAAQYAGLSIETIKSHRKRVMAKLNIHRLHDLARWAADRGFGVQVRGSASPSVNSNSCPPSGHFFNRA
jgi:two-component system, NarL family, response regulator NreC